MRPSAVRTRPGSEYPKGDESAPMVGVLQGNRFQIGLTFSQRSTE